MSTVFIFGSGSFGTALAAVLAPMHRIVLWGWLPEEQKELKESRENKVCLPGVILPDQVEVVWDTKLLPEADSVIIATPTIGVRDAASLCRGVVASGVPIACVAKGFEKVTYKRMSQIITEEVGGANPVVALSGPSHAEEVSREVPTAIVAASEDIKAAEKIQELFIGSKVRIYLSDDIVGTELGGSLKNVIAFAVGITDGFGAGDNTKAALMTRGLTEITRLGVRLGAKQETFSGLSGVGDLIVTCTSMHSRNRRAGMMVGEGLSVTEAVEKVGMVVEGITATRCAYQLAKEVGVEMPITNEIYRMIEGETTPQQAMATLMGRPLKHESEAQWLSGVNIEG